MFNAFVSRSLPLAQLVGGNFRTWSIGEIAIAIIFLAAVVAIVYVALVKFGVVIPAWVIQVFWIVAVAGVCIFAIRLLLGM